MTKNTFKEKSMKKQSLVTKEASNKQHQTQGRPNHTHNPPSNFPQHQTHQKGGCTQLYKEQLCMYATLGQKPEWKGTYTRLLAKNLRGKAHIRDFWPKTCMEKWILV